MADELSNLLKALNTPDRKIKNTVKDKKLVQQLTEVLTEVTRPDSYIFSK